MVDELRPLAEPSWTTRSIEEEWAYLTAEFDLGFSEGLGLFEADRPSVLHAPLAEIYYDRLVWLYETAGANLAVQLLQCEQLAKQLGTLTGRLFAAENVRTDLYFGIPDEKPVLGRKHLEVARDMLGFYLNSSTSNRHRPRMTLQLDRGCPFCA